MSAETPPALVLVLDPACGERERGEILAAAAQIRPGTKVTQGDGWATVALGNGARTVDAESFGHLSGVLRVVPVTTPYWLAALAAIGMRKAIRLDLGATSRRTSVCVGEGQPLAVMITCSSPPGQVPSDLRGARDAGATLLFAGEFRGADGVEAAPADGAAIGERFSVAHELDLGLCLEVANASHIDEAAGLASLIQVGSRNMQDFRLLEALGHSSCPVLLRRGPGATVEEFILAAEYILIHGNGRVILCESGIRTFDSASRPRLEINSIPILKSATHLPVVADPSTATPDAALVPALARAAVAAGADGLVLNVGDDEAAIAPAGFPRLMDELRAVARAVGREER